MLAVFSGLTTREEERSERILELAPVLPVLAKALRLAVDFAGASQILAGSDYPHQIGSIPKMKASLSAVAVSDVERRLILGENAARLYSMT